MYSLARSLHKTVAELLAGRPQPLANAEYTDWIALRNLEYKEAEAERKKQQGKSRRGRRR